MALNKQEVMQLICPDCRAKVVAREQEMADEARRRHEEECRIAAENFERARKKYGERFRGCCLVDDCRGFLILQWQFTADPNEMFVVEKCNVCKFGYPVRESERGWATGVLRRYEEWISSGAWKKGRAMTENKNERHYFATLAEATAFMLADDGKIHAEHDTVLALGDDGRYVIEVVPKMKEGVNRG